MRSWNERSEWISEDGLEEEQFKGKGIDTSAQSYRKGSIVFQRIGFYRSTILLHSNFSLKLWFYMPDNPVFFLFFAAGFGHERKVGPCGRYILLAYTPGGGGREIVSAKIPTAMSTLFRVVFCPQKRPSGGLRDPNSKPTYAALTRRYSDSLAAVMTTCCLFLSVQLFLPPLRTELDALSY